MVNLSYGGEYVGKILLQNFTEVIIEVTFHLLICQFQTMFGLAYLPNLIIFGFESFRSQKDSFQ